MGRRSNSEISGCRSRGRRVANLATDGAGSHWARTAVTAAITTIISPVDLNLAQGAFSAWWRCSSVETLVLKTLRWPFHHTFTKEAFGGRCRSEFGTLSASMVRIQNCSRADLTFSAMGHCEQSAVEGPRS